MFRTDASGHVLNRYDEGDPAVPRLPTQISADHMNALQEEMCGFIEGRGVALVKATNTQFAAAMKLAVAGSTLTINTGGGYTAGSGATEVNYRADSAGTILLDGAATHSSSAEGVRITTLPAGARPASYKWFVVPFFAFSPYTNAPPLTAIGVCTVVIEPNGNVTPFAISGGTAITNRSISLSGITFHP